MEKSRFHNPLQVSNEPKKDEISWKNVTVMLIVAFALYMGINSNISDAIKHIDDVGKRIDYVLYQNQTYEKNMKVLSGTACASCHVQPSMVLPKSSLSMDQFIAYVRGSGRFNSNSQMPKFDPSMMSDAELEKIWKGLY